MGVTGNVHAGLAVYGPDGQLVGTIDSVPGSWMQVAGRYLVPLSMVIRIEPRRVYLAAAARQYLVTPSLASAPAPTRQP